MDGQFPLSHLTLNFDVQNMDGGKNDVWNTESDVRNIDSDVRNRDIDVRDTNNDVPN